MSEPHPQFTGPPVSPVEFSEWFDSDGRLVKDKTMRQRVFEVGIDVSCRRRLWKFLFEIYKPQSTYREQKTLDIENRSQYQALCHRWELLDKEVAMPDDDLSECPPYMELSEDDEGDDSNCCTPAGGSLLAVGRRMSSPFPSPRRGGRGGGRGGCGGGGGGGGGRQEKLRVQSKSVEVNSDNDDGMVPERRNGRNGHRNVCGKKAKKCNPKTTAAIINGVSEEKMEEEKEREEEKDRQPRCECDFKHRSWHDLLDDEGKALLTILQFPSSVFAQRQPLELEERYAKDKRIILRDVLRTDRNFHYFSHNRNLRKVHRILLIYAMFHPKMGYAQGMNDILARFLVVTDSEVDAYWMFEKYMVDKRIDFMEESMMSKVALVKKLVKEIDKDLYDFFESSECHDYLFCHRWLLLDFKREFLFEDSLRIFEVIGTHYMELYSDKAQVLTDKAIAKEFLNEGGEVRPGRGMMNFEFTFDVFLCAAILTFHRDRICRATDAASVYGCLNSLSMNMDLSKVLGQAVDLCILYCRQTVTKGFSEISS